MLTRRAINPSRARALRARQTPTESRLWHELRNRKLLGFKFRRQVPLGRYVVDFAYVERGLVIELDGGQHDLDSPRERQRTQWLDEHGWRVLRFWTPELHDNLGGVIETIAVALESATGSPHPNPLPQAGEGERSPAGRR
jgi:very-short-patch-repair endonuclease